MNEGPRRPFSTGEAIALSSPSGRMSKRARRAAEKRLLVELGLDGVDLRGGPVPQPSEAESLRRNAARLLELAERGMSVAKYRKQAARDLARAAELEQGA